MGKRGRLQIGDLDPDLEPISSTEAKNRFGSVLFDISDGRKFAVNRNGRPVAVILSYRDYHTLFSKLKQLEAKLAEPEEKDELDK